MAEQTALQQAQQQITELLEAAKKGSIIPIRLPGQIEAIATLLEQATDEQRAAAAHKASVTLPTDAQALMHDTAEFFKVAIHDLRTPMTSIRGYSDMLANPGMGGALSEMQAQLLQVIRANSKRMESLLSDMSYMNKIRADLLTVNPKMDMCKNILMMVEKRAKPLADELKRGLIFEVPSGLPLLNTDGELLTHALYKLIENGLRYSAEDTGKVTVTASAEGNLLTIKIVDNGIGMSPEDLAKLGTAFFRSDHDAVRAHKGSGLGVAIAYGIFEALSGEISVESTVDIGTAFTMHMKGMS
ncbi:MAG: HAMP domain-containing histidine kinase [Armatimonadetes bacterium]|nr:HAMP domain-containing histidine kinase [Anaerolineae bacterium]